MKEILNEIINAVNKDNTKYSISYWVKGDRDLLNKYIEDGEYFCGKYTNQDGTIGIFRFMLDNSDLEEWLTVGLTDEELDYIHDKIWEVK